MRKIDRLGLARDGIPVVMADSAAAARMAAGGISWVIVGSDRIAANGDVANKIGTYGLAVAARHHGVRFMVAAPDLDGDRYGNHRRPRDSDRGHACARGPAVRWPAHRGGRCRGLEPGV